MNERGKSRIKGIRNLRIKGDHEGCIRQVSFYFGPHHFLDVRTDEDGRTKFSIGCTHHGFEADASEVNSELERVIEEVRENHRDKVIDSIPH